MRSDTAFFSAADISRRFLAGLASDLSAVAAAFVGEEERRDVERAFGADAPRICSTSVKALISAWRRSISLWRSAIACAISLMPVESSGPAMGMSNTNAGFLSPGRGHVGGSAGSRRGSERGRGHERRPSRHGSDRGRSQKVGDRAGAAATTWAAAHEPYLSLIAPSLVAGVPPDGEVADATRRCCCSPDVGYPGCAPRAVAATAGPRQRRARDLRRGGGALPRHRGLEEVGARGWGFEIEGLAMRGDDHHEAAFAVDVVKDLAPPDSGTVPYLTMRAFIVGGSNCGSTTSSGERAWDWGAGLAPELGFGITEWSTGRRFFIAPEVRVGFFPNIRLSVAVGFTL